MAIFSLDEFKSSPDVRFSKGTWVVEYHDETHLRAKEPIFVSEKSKLRNVRQIIAVFFRFILSSSKQLKKCINNAWEFENQQPDATKRAG